MKSNIIKIILGGFIFLNATSCVEDKGTYTFTPVNEISVVSGIDTENGYKTLSKIDRLELTPEIAGTLSGKDESSLEFKWYIATGEASKDIKRTEIATTKNLDYGVDLLPGSYILYLEIKDKSTGLKWLTSANLSVSSSLTTGFLLFGENEDRTVRLDMISMPADRDTVVFADLFPNETGLKGAKNLVFTGSYYKCQALWAMTDNGSFKLNSSTSFDLDKNASAENMFYTTFNIKHPIQVLDIFPHYNRSKALNGSNRGYITEDGVYYANIIMSETFDNPKNRYSSSSKELFTPYPSAFHTATASSFSKLVLYDMDSNKFAVMNSPTYATNCLEIPSKVDDKFPWNQKDVHRTILYGENLYDTQKSSCTIMKGEDGTYHIYKFVPNTVAQLGYYQVNLDVATNFPQASHFAFSSDQTVLLYSVGSQLWAYNYSYGTAAMLKDFGSEITYLSMEYHSIGEITNFILATYDSTNKGIVRKFDLGTDVNKLEMKERPKDIWKTGMKVKQIQWKDSTY